MTFGPVNAARSTTLTLRGRALRCLAQREHSRVELAGKLRPHAASPGELDALLDDLAANGWLDDQRASDSLVRRQSERFGAARIRRDMQAKGLPPDLVATAIADLQGSELARARTVWLKKFGVPAQTPSERAKHMRFLLGRGFSASIASRVVSGRASDDVTDCALWGAGLDDEVQ
ncbi:MAG: recombination regulator RecX [Burkholderiales bacterium]|nr:recombination regulator RecX [Burkholderiales bacterium]